MSMNELQKQTNTNIQEKANLIWESATHLVGLFKPHEYGKVILPLTVLKRFDDALAPTKQAVLDMKKKLDATNANEQLIEGALTRTSGYAFYNTSKFDFAKLLADPDNIADNFDDYLKGFSANVADIIARFEFAKTVDTMVEGGVLFVMIQEFNSSKADMSPKKITSADMGYIFEELIRKFSESYDEQAGAHFTSRDIIYLMTELLVAPEKDEIKENGCTKTAYDMAMGTSQMLGCLSERLADISEDADLTCFGQEFNPETYATKDTCTTPIIPKWKMELIAHEIFTKHFTDISAVTELACKMIEEHINDVEDVEDNTEIIAQKNAEIEKLERKKVGLIEMRADGDIERDYFLMRKDEVEKQIECLRQEIQELTPIDTRKKKENLVERLEALKQKLSEYTDFENTLIIPDGVIEAFTEQIIASDKGFDWYLKAVPDMVKSFMDDTPDDETEKEWHELTQFDLTIEDAKAYVYSFSSRRRVHGWQNIKIRLFV